MMKVMRKEVGPPGKPRADSFAESNVYICPALMLHQIRKQLGDQAFFDPCQGMSGKQPQHRAG